MGGDGAFSIAPPEVRRSAVAALSRAVARWSTAGPPVLAAGAEGPDRWFVRLASADKDVLTVWWLLRQRTLGFEAQVMPAPDTAADVHAYLLRRNRHLPQLRFALGPEDSVLLVGELPVGQVDDDALDRVVAAVLSVVDDCYATAMALGFPSWYQRRPRRSTGRSVPAAEPRQ